MERDLEELIGPLSCAVLGWDFDSQALGMPNLVTFLDQALWRSGDSGHDYDYAHSLCRH